LYTCQPLSDLSPLTFMPVVWKRQPLVAGVEQWGRWCPLPLRIWLCHPFRPWSKP